MVISFTGPQCSGKTTLLNKCMEHYGNRFDYITEVTRPIARKGLKINEEGNSQTQRAIIDSHLKNSTLKNVIMDRCIIDGLLYTSYLYTKGTVDMRTWEYAYQTFRQILGKIDLIFYTKSVDMVDDGVRSVNEDFRKTMIELFESNITDLLNGKYPEFSGRAIILDGDVDKRFNDIIMSIEQYECTAR